MKQKRSGRGSSLPLRLPLKNEYTHLDGYIILRHYEERRPKDGSWPTKDDCVSYLWKDGKPPVRHRVRAADLIFDGILYWIFSQLRLQKLPLYRLTQVLKPDYDGRSDRSRKHFKYKPLKLNAALASTFTSAKKILWQNNRANISKSLICRALKFEAAWILEALPYYEQQGWSVKEDRLRRGRASVSLRDAAVVTMAAAIKHLPAQPREMQPYWAYVNARMKTLAKATLEYKSNGPAKAIKIDGKRLMESTVRYKTADLLMPLRAEIEEYLPAFARLVDWDLARRINRKP